MAYTDPVTTPFASNCRNTSGRAAGSDHRHIDPSHDAATLTEISIRRNQPRAFGERGRAHGPALRWCRSATRCHVLRALPQGVGQLLALIAPALLNRLGGALRGTLGDVLAAIERFLPGLPRVLLQLIGELAQPRVLCPARRHDHPREEADRNRCE